MNSTFIYSAKGFFNYRHGSRGDKQFLLDVENLTPIQWKEERECIEVYKSLDSSEQAKEEAIQKIVNGNLQYITVAVIKSVKYTANDEFFMLINDMVIDLIKSIKNFNPSKAPDGLSLWNYANNLLRMKTFTHHVKSRKFLHGDWKAYVNSKKMETEEKAIGHPFSLEEIMLRFDCTRTKAKGIKKWRLEYISVNEEANSESKNKDTKNGVINLDKRIDFIPHNPAPYERISKEDDSKFMRKAIKKLLTAEQFGVVDLVYFQGLTRLSAQNKLGINAKSVDNYLHSSLRKLRKNKEVLQESLF
jgi:RNA polymerase sigma factor (sigma-70 family)